MERHEIDDRARIAGRVFDSPDYQALVKHLKHDLFEAFCSTNVLDDVGRDELHKLSYAVDLLNKKIQQYKAAANLEAYNATQNEQAE